MSDVRTGREVLRLYSLNDGSDWLVQTPDGRFDGSENARSLVDFSWRPADFKLTNDQTVLDKQRRLKEEHYVPGLMLEVAEKLNTTNTSE